MYIMVQKGYRSKVIQLFRHIYDLFFIFYILHESILNIEYSYNELWLVRNMLILGFGLLSALENVVKNITHIVI